MHIILGGTSGLGLEMARQLRENGKRVLVLGKTHNTQEHGEGFQLDVYYPEQVEAAPARIEQILGDDNVEQFVWAAGYGWRGNFDDQPDARSMAEVNFAGALPLVQWARLAVSKLGRTRRYTWRLNTPKRAWRAA